MTRYARSALPWIAGLLLGCAADSEGATSADSAGRDLPTTAPGAGNEAPAGAEQEVESFYEAPIATGRYVWIANSKSGRVAYVDATTLQVRTVEAGNGPTYLAAIPSPTDDAAIVLNTLSQDATYFKSGAQGLSTRSFKTAPFMNRWSVSADGAFAIAWADARKNPTTPKTQGYQDLTVIDLVHGTSTTLAVGYRPVAVGFSANSARAYAVTQDGITILDLATGAPHVTKNVAISDQPVTDPGTRDVSVTPDGTLALIRRDGVADITVVSLETGTRVLVKLPNAVTDLDLTSAGDKAVAVVRDASSVVILPVPGIAASPLGFTSVSIPGETIGSVVLSPGGELALLYTNATPVERVTLLSLGATPTFRTVRVYSPVFSIHSAPNAKHAVVLHPPASGSGAGNAFSLLPTGADLPPRIVPTLATPYAVAVTDDHAVVAERDDATKIYGVHLARLPELTDTRYDLASPPVAVGVIPSVRRAYVAQRHPEGRITFIHLDTGLTNTLTGFELAARVVDGSKP